MAINNYVEYTFILSQVSLALFALSYLEVNAKKRLLIISFVLFSTALCLISSTLQISRSIYVGSIYVHAVIWSALPVFFSNIKTISPSKLEIIINVQQSILRLICILWTFTHLEEVKNYRLFELFSPLCIGLSFFVVLAGISFLKKQSWSFFVQSGITLFFIQMSLHAEAQGLEVLFYVAILFLSGTFFIRKESKTLRRLEVASLGSGMFFSALIIIYETRGHGLIGSLSWVLLMYVMGLGSWFKQMPDYRFESKSRVLCALRYALQIAYIVPIIVFFREMLL